MEKRNIKNCKVEVVSSLVEFLEYDYLKLKLLAKFKKGRKRTHSISDVSPTQFWRMLESESVGRSVLELVKRK